MLRFRRAWMVMVVISLLVCSAWSQARATVDAELLQGTESLLGIPIAWQHGKPRSLVLNGALLQVRSGHSKDSLHALLDRAAEDCQVKSAGLHARAKRIAQHAKRPLPGLADGILRSEHASEGLVACLDLGPEEASWGDLAERLRRFAVAGDLQVLGGIRLVRAQARPEGAFFVTLVSVGSVALPQMFPSEGDAPGLDFTDVPRPIDTRRILSAWQEDGAPALNIYESKQGKARVLADYQRLLLASGWRPDHESSRGSALLLIKGGHQLALSAEAEGVHSLVVVMPLDMGPGAI